MKVGAEILASHRFPSAWRGYARSEVDAVMGAVVSALADNEHRLDGLEAHLTEAREAQAAIQTTMLAAHRAGEEILDRARQQSQDYRDRSDRMIADAKAEASRIQREARDQAVQLTKEARVRAAAIEAAAESASAAAGPESWPPAETTADLREAEARIAVLRSTIQEVEARLRGLAELGLSRTTAASARLELTDDPTREEPEDRPAPAGSHNVIPIPNGSGAPPASRTRFETATTHESDRCTVVLEEMGFSGQDGEPQADLTPFPLLVESGFGPASDLGLEPEFAAAAARVAAEPVS